MKQILHKESPTQFRVIQRGGFFYFQQNDGREATRESDPWTDVGFPKDTVEGAIALMYSKHPMVQP